MLEAGSIECVFIAAEILQNYVKIYVIVLPLFPRFLWLLSEGITQESRPALRSM